MDRCLPFPTLSYRAASRSRTFSNSPSLTVRPSSTSTPSHVLGIALSLRTVFAVKSAISPNTLSLAVPQLGMGSQETVTSVDVRTSPLREFADYEVAV
jgi:hypothetical protein